MKVILLQELKGTGIEGDVVDVERGFANNYLLPQGLAELATPGNLKQLEQRRHNIEKREEARTAAANEMKEKIDGLVEKLRINGEAAQKDFETMKVFLWVLVAVAGCGLICNLVLLFLYLR